MTLRIAIIGAALALSLAAGGFARADQNDPRLSDLFDRLAATSDPNEAAVVQSLIWRVWTASGSASVDLLMSRGADAMNRRDFEAAGQFYSSAIALAPDYAEGWNKRATLYFLTNDYGKSVADIERTLALEPRHFGALSGLGMIMSALGKKDKALEAYRAALAVNPHLPNASEAVEALSADVDGRGI